METIYAAGNNCSGNIADYSLAAGQAGKTEERCAELRFSEIGRSEVKRDAFGNIDFEFYQQRARHLRAAEFFSVTKTIMRFIFNRT